MRKTLLVTCITASEICLFFLPFRVGRHLVQMCACRCVSSMSSVLCVCVSHSASVLSVLPEKTPPSSPPAADALLAALSKFSLGANELLAAVQGTAVSSIGLQPFVPTIRALKDDINQLRTFLLSTPELKQQQYKLLMKVRAASLSLTHTHTLSLSFSLSLCQLTLALVVDASEPPHTSAVLTHSYLAELAVFASTRRNRRARQEGGAGPCLFGFFFGGVWRESLIRCSLGQIKECLPLARHGQERRARSPALLHRLECTTSASRRPRSLPLPLSRKRQGSGKEGISCRASL